MRPCFVVLSVVSLTLIACQFTAQPPGASVAASAVPSTAGSTEAAAPPTQAPQPTLIPTAAQSSAAVSAGASASAVPEVAASGSPAASLQPSAAAAPPYGRALQLADPRLEGDDVRLLQQRLVDLGYTRLGAVDGVFGPLTGEAVRAFQQINGLDLDGVVGPRTWERLFGDARAASALAPVVALPTGWLLGSSVDQRWLDVESTVALLQGGERYRVPGTATSYSGELPATPDVPCEFSYVIPLTPDPPGVAPVAVGGAWDPLPRRAADESPTGEQYRDAVAAFLNGEGIAQPDVRIVRVLRVDLDGDGSAELLINATLFAQTEGIISPNAAAGEYSVVLLQRAGASTAVPVVANVYAEDKEFIAPSRFTLVGAFDLNGDGQMEVIVDGAYYEGAYTAVYDVLGSEPTMVLENGCGV